MPDTPELLIIEDRRTTRRTGTNAQARLTLPDGAVVEGVFVDLSRQGGRFRAPRDLSPLPDSALVRVGFRDLVMTARVTWHKGFHHGTQAVSVLGLEAVDDPET